jgi:hypothetical protein
MSSSSSSIGVVVKQAASTESVTWGLSDLAGVVSSTTALVSQKKEEGLFTRFTA